MGSGVPAAYDVSNAATPMTSPVRTQAQKEPRATSPVGEVDGVHSAVPRLRAMRSSNLNSVSARRRTAEIAAPIRLNIARARKNARIPGSTAMKSVSTRNTDWWSASDMWRQTVALSADAGCVAAWKKNASVFSIGLTPSVVALAVGRDSYSESALIPTAQGTITI